MSEKIEKYASQAQQSLQKGVREHSSQTKKLEQKLVDRLFVRLSTNYGHLFMSQFQTGNMLHAAKTEWAIDLAEFSIEQIGRAIERMKDEYPDKPPTLPQFRKLCKVKHNPAHSPYVALPKPKTDKEKVAQHIADMKAKLA